MGLDIGSVTGTATATATQHQQAKHCCVILRGCQSREQGSGCVRRSSAYCTLGSCALAACKNWPGQAAATCAVDAGACPCRCRCRASSVNQPNHYQRAVQPHFFLPSLTSWRTTRYTEHFILELLRLVQPRAFRVSARLHDRKATVLLCRLIGSHASREHLAQSIRFFSYSSATPEFVFVWCWCVPN